LQSKPSRKKKQEQGNVGENMSMPLKSISPKTTNQERAFRDYGRAKTPFLHGLPGTGKTFVALYLALKSVLIDKTQKRVVIVRSAVPTRDIGFLPGSAGEKMRNYEAPYAAIATKLFERGDAYEVLKQKKLIEFMPTSFIRGLDIEDAVIVIDEAQNMSYQEIRSVITRTGRNSRVVICADRAQDDLTSKRFNEESGIDKLMGVMKKMPSVSFTEFGVDDIVRSDFIREYIIAEYDIRPAESEEPALPGFIREPARVRED
jgi:phosphate starvation-inducible protein PhoH